MITAVYRNTALLSAANYLGAIFNTLAMVLLARHLPVENYGALNAAINAAFLTFQVVELGVAQIFTKRMAEHDEQPMSAYHEVFSLRLLLGLAVLLLLVVGGPLLGATPDAHVLLSLIGVAVLFDFLSDVSFAMLRARQAMGYESFANLLRSVILCGGAAAWMALPSLRSTTPGLIGLLFAGATLAKWLFTLSVLRVRPTMVLGEGARRAWLHLLRESTPIGLSTLLSQVMLRAAPLLILFFRGDREVGVFSPSYLIFSGLQIAWTAFLLSLFPHMARVHARTPGALWATWSRALVQLTAVTGGIAVAVWLVRRPVIGLVFGQEYLETLRVLPWLLLANSLLALTSLCGGALTVLGAGRQIAMAYAAALLVSLSLDVTLIPRIGFVGAGVAAVVGQVALLGLLVLLMVRERSRLSSAPVLTAA